jgi:hypothetical protein
LRQEQYHTAKQAAVEVLRQDPKNIKALLRAAKAALLDPASTLEEVEAALKAAETEITYKNPSEEKQLKQLKVQFKKKRHEYKEQSKAMFGNKLKASNAFLSGDEPADEKTNDNNEAKEIALPPKKSVSFDETTTKPPRETGGTKKKDKKKHDKNSFWKTQGLAMLFQAIVPMVFFFVYRMIMKAISIGNSTLAGNEAAMPQVDEEMGGLSAEI